MIGMGNEMKHEVGLNVELSVTSNDLGGITPTHPGVVDQTSGLLGQITTSKYIKESKLHKTLCHNSFGMS